MNLALRKPMTLAEFLEWEERQPLRYEFDGVGPVAMVGGTAGHADIQANLAAALRTRLRGKPCRFYGSDLKFQVAGPLPCVPPSIELRASFTAPSSSSKC
jgi:Uma2 family endonuclease